MLRRFLQIPAVAVGTLLMSGGYMLVQVLVVAGTICFMVGLGALLALTFRP